MKIIKIKAEAVDSVKHGRLFEWNFLENKPRHRYIADLWYGSSTGLFGKFWFPYSYTPRMLNLRYSSYCIGQAFVRPYSFSDAQLLQFLCHNES